MYSFSLDYFLLFLYFVQIAGLSLLGDTSQMVQNREKGENSQVRKNTFMREKDVKKDEMDELIDSFKRMEIKMANIEQGNYNNRRYDNSNGVRGRCYNCNRTGHIARDCRMQRNFGQNGKDIICNICGRIGHL